MNDRARNKGRMAIYTMAGFYLLYMSTRIFKGLPDSSGSEKIVLLLAMVAFAAIGVGLMGWASWTGYKMVKEEREAMSDAEQKKKDTKTIEEVTASENTDSDSDHKKNTDTE